jgi:hypothetical protein
MDSDDLNDGELNYSDEESNVVKRGAKKMNRKKKANVYKMEKADTNIFSIALSNLKENAELATGDPIYCKECKVVFNKFSPLDEEQMIGGKQMWRCEFCHTNNPILIEKEEVPKSDTVSYLLEGAIQK